MRRSRWIPLLVTFAVLPWTLSRAPEPEISYPDPIVLTDSSHLQAVIAAGYRERMRLGLGSPFRLIDLALHDPRLDSISRLQTARSIFQGTLRGSGYQVDPLALDVIFNPNAGPWAGSGAFHLATMDGAIRGENDPRTGELIVRLAYRLAAMEGTLESAGLVRAAHAAAMLRDREMARRDARLLAAEAKRRGTDPVALVPEWRRALRFGVEKPALQELPVAGTRRAVAEAPRLLAKLRKSGSTLSLRTVVPPLPFQPMPAPVAGALARVAERTGMPPQTAVAVRVRFAGRALRLPEGPVEQAWAEFEKAALDEEQLVAQRALALRRSPALRRAVAGVVLDAAVDLRTFAQERPWFPGSGGPTRDEVMERHGVWVVLDGDVPRSWGPYYRRAVDQSARHVKQALPGVSLRGLTVRISRNPDSKWALARHNPRKRIIRLPTTTGPGTLAHEMAHDLDRQAAVRLYGERGRYASNRAARNGRGPLAPALERLGEGSRGITRRVHPQGRQPAEVFARNVDWYVTTSLALRGISNGYLSSAQDDVLTGHGTVRPPGPPGSYDEALLTAVRALIPTESRRWALAARVRRTPAPSSVLRLVAAPGPAPSMPLGASLIADRPHAGVDGAAAVRARAFRLLERWTCGGAQTPADRELTRVYRRLIELGAAARSRHLAVSMAEQTGGMEARRRVLRALYAPVRILPELGRGPAADLARGLVPALHRPQALAAIADTVRLREASEPCASAALFGALGPPCVDDLLGLPGKPVFSADEDDASWPVCRSASGTLGLPVQPFQLVTASRR